MLWWQFSSWECVDTIIMICQTIFRYTVVRLLEKCGKGILGLFGDIKTVHHIWKYLLDHQFCVFTFMCSTGNWIWVFFFFFLDMGFPEQLFTKILIFPFSNTCVFNQFIEPFCIDNLRIYIKRLMCGNSHISYI